MSDGLYKMTEPFINSALLEKVRRARETTFDADIEFDNSAEENRHLSELYRIVSNYDTNEMAACVAAILDREAEIVYQVLCEDRNELSKGRKENEND